MQPTQATHKDVLWDLDGRQKFVFISGIDGKVADITRLQIPANGSSEVNREVVVVIGVASTTRETHITNEARES